MRQPIARLLGRAAIKADRNNVKGAKRRLKKQWNKIPRNQRNEAKNRLEKFGHL